MCLLKGDLGDAGVPFSLSRLCLASGSWRRPRQPHPDATSNLELVAAMQGLSGSRDPVTMPCPWLDQTCGSWLEMAFGVEEIQPSLDGIQLVGTLKGDEKGA